MKNIFYIFLWISCISCGSLCNEDLPIPRDQRGDRKLSNLRPKAVWENNKKADFETSFIHYALIEIIKEHPSKDHPSEVEKFLCFSGKVSTKSYVFNSLPSAKGFLKKLKGLQVGKVSPEPETWRLDIQKEVADGDYVNLQLQYGSGNNKDTGGALASINVKKGVKWELTHLYYVLAQSHLDSEEEGKIVTRNVDDPFFSVEKGKRNSMSDSKSK